jgi:hypothetical protein
MVGLFLWVSAKTALMPATVASPGPKSSSEQRGEVAQCGIAAFCAFETKCPDDVIRPSQI